jgi:endonuclease YncB( thermonuclease family)
VTVLNGSVLALILSVLAPDLSTGIGFTGQVVSVLDGDTIEVLHNQHPERIRLSGIDCPEKGQAIGNLEQSCPDANLRALIQMATGPGCT